MQSMKLEKNHQQILLELSRKSLVHFFENGEKLRYEEEKIEKGLRVKRATFVTLTKDGSLRGCIGKLKAVNPICKDVIENTYSAAFSDPRFPPLSKKELDELTIEISVLDKPKILNYSNYEDLIQKLSKSKPGVILKHGFHQATFLPQVWHELPTVDEFLGHLCLKAGLPSEFWKREKLEIQVYNVVKFKE
ncbi:AmmeMemoRadiSam system protein A [Candidatus Dojkabacteria bacterium]|nr:AmmeMemoRadiSam system protein A [Candidatus Dojkabacteria bacterium]